MNRLAGADQAMASVIVTQSQLVADINRAPDLAAEAGALTKEMRAALTDAAEGVDTDGDGLSDIAEAQTQRSSPRSSPPCGRCPGVEPITFDRRQLAIDRPARPRRSPRRSWRPFPGWRPTFRSSPTR